MYWYLGCLDFGKFGFYALFRVQQKDENVVFIRFNDNNEFYKDEILDEHRVIRSTLEQEYEYRMSERYITLDYAIQHIIMNAINHINRDSEKEKLELSLCIARRIRLADPRF